MLSDAELNQYREECEVHQQWSNVTCHVIADLLEVCSVCGTVRDKERLVRCPWCDDLYCCREDACTRQHRSSAHPAAANWAS
jgi:hypothetical protein